MKKPKPTDPKKPGETNKEGYPLYPDRDDIYKRAEEVKDLNDDDLTPLRDDDDQDFDPEEELDFEEEVLIDDLDVPGSELDDDDEEIGNGDEENNYYSIGGDNHEDLEEDNQDYDLPFEDEDDES
jgi:hypothetical protein